MIIIIQGRLGVSGTSAIVTLACNLQLHVLLQALDRGCRQAQKQEPCLFGGRTAHKAIHLTPRRSDDR